MAESLRLGAKLARVPRELRRYLRGRAARIEDCQSWLAVRSNRQGERRVVLTNRCHDPLCPSCARSRSAELRRELVPAAERLGGRWLMLTLTAPNVPSTGEPVRDSGELRTLAARLKRAAAELLRQEFPTARGALVAVEITGDSERGFHPHAHALLSVPPSYFSGPDYRSQERLQSAWSELLGVSLAIVDVRAVRGRKGLRGGVAEVCTYLAKPADVSGETVSPSWLAALAIGSKGLRRFEVYGGLRETRRAVREELEREPGEELLGPVDVYRWSRSGSRYRWVRSVPALASAEGLRGPPERPPQSP